MKKLQLLPIILGFILFYPLGMLSAQTAFYSFDFTTGEGFTSGTINELDPEGDDWAVWPNDTLNPSLAFDTSGTGNLIIDAMGKNTFQLVKFVGFGSELSGNKYYGEVKMTLHYEVGTSATISGATVLPFIAFRGLNDSSKSMGFGLRQVNQANTFNFFANSGPVGGWTSTFAPAFSGEQIGLAIDEAELWTDGVSDEILIRFSMVNTEADLWVLTSTVYNLTTSTDLGTVTMDVTDGDGTFTNQPHFVEFQDDNMHLISGAVHIDSLSINFAPLPDVELTTLWAGYEVDETGWVDTGAWMGWLNVAQDPWIWSQDLQDYLYVGGISETGAWIFVPGN